MLDLRYVCSLKYVVLDKISTLCDSRCFLVDKFVGLSLLEPLRASVKLSGLFLQVVIFVKTVQRCVALNQLLVEQNFPSICIHRGMPQEER